MAHEIQDKDLHFLIDPITRAITNQTAAKVKLMQFDHNSERFTFEVPRFVEGHDMSLCTKVEVHYINIAGDKQAQHADVYRVEDMTTEGDGDAEKVTFSWLVSAGATQYAGSLSFLIRFSCLTGEKLDYVWNTDTFKGISIGQGMNNGDAVLDDYSDVLAAWETQISTHIEVVEALREEVEGLKEITPEVVHETGDSTDAVMSQAAVTAALDDIKENGGSVELAPDLSGNDTDKAPSVAAVNEGLEGKLDKKTTPTTGTFAYAFNKNGSIAQEITFTAKEWTIAQYRTGGRLRVADPNLETDAANKKYVDEAIEALQEDIGGGNTELKAVTGHYVEGYYVPEGALPNFYLETTDFEYSTDGSGGGMYPVKFTLLQFYDASGGYIESVEAKPNSYYTMPSGTAKIVTNASEFVDMGDDDNPDNNYDAYNVNMPYLVFQVEV